MSHGETGDRTSQFNLQLTEAMVRGWGKQLDCFGNVSLPLITAFSGSCHEHTLGSPWLSWGGSCSRVLFRYDLHQSKLLLHFFSEKKPLRSKTTSVTYKAHSTAFSKQTHTFQVPAEILAFQTKLFP